MKKTIAWLLIMCCLVALSACNAASGGKGSGGKDFDDFFQKPSETDEEFPTLAPTAGDFDNDSGAESMPPTTAPDIQAPTVAPDVLMPTAPSHNEPQEGPAATTCPTMPAEPGVEATMPSPTEPGIEPTAPGDGMIATIVPTMPGPTEPAVTEPVEEEQGIQVLSWPKTIARNTIGEVRIKGKPNTEYTIKVYYKSGMSTAAGLEPKIADSEGYVTWSWKVHSRTTPGTYQIVVEGNGEEYTLIFTVT